MSIQVSILFNVECESSYKRHIISIIFVPRVYPHISMAWKFQGKGGGYVGAWVLERSCGCKRDIKLRRILHAELFL